MYDVVNSKVWIHEKGYYPSRVVLLYWAKKKEWTVHIQMQVENGQYALISGHWFIDEFEALMDFEKRTV